MLGVQTRPLNVLYLATERTWECPMSPVANRSGVAPTNGGDCCKIWYYLFLVKRDLAGENPTDRSVPELPGCEVDGGH